MQLGFRWPRVLPVVFRGLRCVVVEARGGGTQMTGRPEETGEREAMVRADGLALSKRHLGRGESCSCLLAVS